MKHLLAYYRRSFLLELKKTVIYPFSFWVIALVWPLYSFIQIVFLETIYSQTAGFAGYAKYDAYVIFGTFSMIQTLGHLFFYRRLADFGYLIKGNARASLDTELTKPIDAQLYTTTGRFNLGNIVPSIVGFAIVCYGMFQRQQTIPAGNIAAYVVMVPLGILIYYIIYSCISICLFWFPRMQMTEYFWESLQTFGQYPQSLYRGGAGMLFNIAVPVTLMAGVPSDLLLGKIPPYRILLYYGLVGMLLLLTRLWWTVSVSRYSSSSS